MNKEGNNFIHLITVIAATYSCDFQCGKKYNLMSTVMKQYVILEEQSQ